MKKLSKLTESLWTDIQSRSAGDTLRKEDGVIKLILNIDGQEYKFTDIFLSMGDAWNEENSDEWSCFAFNKPKDGSTLITGNTEDVGAFGISSEDVENSPYNDGIYEVYVLKEFIDKPKDKLIYDMLSEASYNDLPNKSIQDIIKKYVTKIFDEGHMSDYAYYTLFDVDPSDFERGSAIWYYKDDDPTDVEILDEFDKYEIECIDFYSYANWEGWSDELEKELTEEYEKMGYVKSQYDGIDPWGGVPHETSGVAFVKLGKEKEDTGDSEEDDEEYRDF